MLFRLHTFGLVSAPFGGWHLPLSICGTNARSETSMTQIFDNAVASLRLGIEDFKTGNDDRMLSAARNYYAGLLLLAKECLVKEVPKADAMEVIGAKFKPKPDGEGGVVHVPEGYTTVDLNQLKKRFNDFGLNWPNADIKKLQEFRNDLEHLHLKEPVSLLRRR
jgi:hypothetical protein